MIIKELTLDHFKSFKKANILFYPDINIIIGPNGSGKSNICDALKFLLGEKSLSQLRAKSSKDLIYRGASEARVRGVFQTSEGEVELERGIHKDKVYYKINGKKVSRGDYVSFLALHGITNSNRIFILQGQIDKLVGMGKKEREQFFADGAGTIHFDIRKEEALKEIAFVDRRISEINIVLGEKLALMEELEKEVERARQFMSIKERMELLRQNILLRMYKEKKAQLERFKEEQQKLLEEKSQIEGELARIKERIKEIEAEKAKLVEELSNSERAQAYAELEKVKEELEKKRAELRQYETLRFEKSKLHKELLERRQQLAREVESLERYAKAQEDDKIDKAIQKLKSITQELAEVEKEIGELKGRLESIGAFASEIGNLEELKKELSQTQQKIMESFQEERELTESIKQLEKRIGELRKKQGELSAYGMRSTLMEFIKDLREQIPGIYDLVINLIEFDPMYAEAVDAMGGRLLNVVVEDLEVAKKLSQIFKERKLGRISIIPLKELVVEYVPDVNVGMGRLRNYIKTDPRFQKVVDYVFGDVVLVREFDDAKPYIGKYRMVTLGGEFFERSGVVTVGKSHQAISSAKVLRQIEEELAQLEKEKHELNRKLYEYREYVQTLREKKSRLESEIKMLEKTLNAPELQQIKDRLAQLEEKKAQLLKEKEALDKFLEQYQELVKEREKLGEYREKKAQLEQLDQQIKALDSEIKALDAKIRMMGDSIRIQELKVRQKEAQYLRMDENLKRLMRLSSEKEEELKNLGLEQQKLLEKLSKVEKRLYKLEAELNVREQELKELESKLVEPKEILDMGVEKMEEELARLEGELANLGNINFRAQEQYEQLSQDIKDIKEKIDKLRKEKEDLIALIKDLEIKKMKYFREYISKVNEKFREYTLMIPNFGEGKIEYDKEIQIKLIRNNRAIRLEALSGGERSLLGLLLVFAMNTIRPITMAVFDEVDAALDKLNVQRLTNFIQEQSQKTQFIIVTHNPLMSKIGRNVIGVAKQGMSSALAQIRQ
ncbi:MAG: AAA family ATPase [Candidatus Micrarchaeota archaeon]|nr:AAA family ATPase [Candidatus Micrarchaeota archaeon]